MEAVQPLGGRPKTLEWTGVVEFALAILQCRLFRTSLLPARRWELNSASLTGSGIPLVRSIATFKGVVARASGYGDKDVSRQRDLSRTSRIKVAQFKRSSLAELDRGLIRQLFWDGRRADDLAREWGVSRQAVSKRQQKILLELRRQVGMPLGELRENFRDFRRPAVADSIEPAYYSKDLIRRTRVMTLVPSAGPFVVVLVIPNLASQN